jgi:hypothetical protein
MTMKLVGVALKRLFFFFSLNMFNNSLSLYFNKQKKRAEIEYDGGIKSFAWIPPNKMWSKKKCWKRLSRDCLFIVRAKWRHDNKKKMSKTCRWCHGRQSNSWEKGHLRYNIFQSFSSHSSNLNFTTQTLNWKPTNNLFFLYI